MKRLGTGRIAGPPIAPVGLYPRGQKLENVRPVFFDTVDYHSLETQAAYMMWVTLFRAKSWAWFNGLHVEVQS